MTQASSALLRRIEDRASWLAAWMVDWANHKPENEGHKPKVGGHQASSMSCSTILAALYLQLKRPCDRIAVKPHAAPLLYVLMYLLGRVSRDQIMRLREFDGLQPYPSQHDNPDFVDYSTSIEGLGPAAVVADAYEAIVQRDQLHMTTWPTYHAIVGDGELAELQIGGALYEAGRRRLGNVRWWVDLNRQSLDRPMEDGPGGSLATWTRALFEAHGWHVIELRWGARLRAAFEAPGGAALRTRLETLSDSHLQALLFAEPDVARRALLGQVVDERPAVQAFLEEFARTAPGPPDGLADAMSDLDDMQVAALVQDMGGHDLDAVLDAAARADAVTDRPTAIICHTVKGWRMPGWSGHPENHGALMTATQLEAYRVRVLGAAASDPWAGFAPDSEEGRFLATRADVLFPATVRQPVAWPSELLPTADDTHIPLIGERSTATAFGMLNAAWARLPIGRRMAFLAPDVGLTTHLGGVIAATGVYDPHPTPDLGKLLRDQHHAMFGWRLTREGRFHSLPINEGLAAMALYAFGRPKWAAEGKQQMIPVGTIYDAFWKHAYTQVYFALYDGARFLAVGTPSGTSLSRESGTHQSVQAPAIFAGLPGILVYEPAYAFDVKVIYDWAVRQMMQPEGEAVYLRLSTQDLVQPFGTPAAALLQHHGLASMPVFDETPAALARLEHDIVAGAYRLLDRRGGPGRDARRTAATILATGPVMEEALRASQRLHDEHGLFVSVCNVTSWDRLERDWSRCELAVAQGDDAATHHLNELLDDDELVAPMVVVGDFSPQLAAWVGTALGRFVPVLGPRQFSQAGDLASVRRLHGIDADAIARALLAQVARRAPNIGPRTTSDLPSDL